MKLVTLALSITLLSGCSTCDSNCVTDALIQFGKDYGQNLKDQASFNQQQLNYQQQQFQQQQFNTQARCANIPSNTVVPGCQWRP